MELFVQILLAGAIMLAIAVVFGVILVVCSHFLTQKKDDRQEKIEGLLARSNCGGCGKAGCAQFAEALLKGEAKLSDCRVTTTANKEKIAEILGGGDVGEETVAVVHCNGTSENSVIKLQYQGVQSCTMASQLFGGQKACVYGCLGYGDCVKACPYDAIQICDGVARVDPLACKACKKCITTCPKGLIELVPLYETKAAVLCKNHNKGAFTRKECKVGCIGCMKCTKVCESDAIKVANNTAHVDYDKCIGCGKCMEACPVGAIHIMTLGK